MIRVFLREVETRKRMFVGKFFEWQLEDLLRTLCKAVEDRYKVEVLDDELDRNN